MAYRSFLDLFGFGRSEGSSGRLIELDADGAATVVVPDPQLLLGAEFKKSGQDLVLLGRDGTTVLIHDYFKSDQRPTLKSPDGAQLLGSLVEILAGAAPHDDYAQAGGAQAAAAAIGKIEKISGTATIVRNGVAVVANVGDPVYKNDVVQTASGSTLSVSFIDGTVFTLSADARLVLNEMIYDPAGSQNSALLTLVQGAMTAVAGQVAKTGDMKVATPTATMGIRGTTFYLQVDVVDAAGTKQTITLLLTDADGTQGRFDVFDTSGNFLGTMSETDVAGLINAAGNFQNVPIPASVQALAQALRSEAVGIAGFQQLTPTPDGQAPSDGGAGGGGGGSSGQPFAALPVDNTPIPIVNTPAAAAGLTVASSETDPATTTTTPGAGGGTNTEAVVVGEDEPAAEGSPPPPGSPTFSAALTQIVTNPASLLTARSQTELAGFATIDPSNGNLTLDNSAFGFLGEGEVIIYTVQVTTTAADGTTSVESRDVLVFGRNDAPQFTSGAPVTTTNGAIQSTAGVLVFADIDLTDTHTVSVSPNEGAFGTLSVVLQRDTQNGAGGEIAFSYSVDLSDPSVKALVANHIESFTVTVTDEHGLATTRTIQVTIPGVDDPAEITGTATGAVTEPLGVGGPDVQVTGDLDATDVDGPDDLFQVVTNPTTSAQGFGVFTVTAAGVWTFTLDEENATVRALTSSSPPLTDTFIVRTIDGAEQAVTITINGSETVITGPITGAVTEAGGVDNGAPGVPTATGDLQASGGDAFQAVTSQTGSANGFGAFTVTAAGVWTYTLNNANAKVQGLNVGSPALQDMFTVVAADGTKQVVTISISGANDAATISGDTEGELTPSNDGSGGGGSVTGDLLADDIDNPYDVFQAVTTPTESTSGLGAYTVTDDGVWTYELNDFGTAAAAAAEGPLTDTFTVLSQDGTEQVVTITINEPDGPAAAADTVNASEDGVTLIYGNELLDNDEGEGLEIVGVSNDDTVGGHASFNDTTGQVFYSADGAYDFLGADDTASDTFDYTVEDDNGQQATAQVTVIIDGENDDPTIDAEDSDLDGDVTIGGSGSDSGQLFADDPDQGDSKTWSVVSSSGLGSSDQVFLQDDSSGGGYSSAVGDFGTLTVDENDGTWTYQLYDQYVGEETTYTDEFTVRVEDEAGEFDEETLTITIHQPEAPPNSPPEIVAAATIADGEITATPTEGDGTLHPTAASYLAAGRNLINGLGGPKGFGEGVLPANDDGSTTSGVNITSVFGEGGLNFFGTSYTSIFVNNNGNITFTGPFSTFTPAAFQSNVIIAAFWADVDTRTGPRPAATPDGTSTGSNLVYYDVDDFGDLDNTTGAVTITWDDVGYYNQGIDKLNAFQLQLINRGSGDFDIVYRYEDINWTSSGGLGGTPARVGYSSGDGDHFEFDQSNNQAALLELENAIGDTTGRAGVHVFQVRNGDVAPAQPEAMGVITFTDPDTSDMHSAAFASQGESYVGTFSLDEDVTATAGGGSIGWRFTIEADDLEGLAEGPPIIQRYDVTISDGHTGGSVTQTITVTITGANDAPVIVGGVTSGEVQEDGNPTVGGMLDAEDPDHNATQAWTVVPSYAFSLDNLLIRKNGNATPFFLDDFADGTPPPSVPAGSTPPGYGTSGTFTEAGGKLILSSDGAVSVGAAGAPQPFVANVARLQTDTSADPDRGLKSDDTFDVEARFDLSFPSAALQSYGIRLTDHLPLTTGSQPPQVGDDEVSLFVRRGADGLVRVQLVQVDRTATETDPDGSFTILGGALVNPPAAATQIVLRLSHVAGVETAGDVIGTFDYLNASGAKIGDTHVLREIDGDGEPVGHIFSGDETWTRVDIVAASPSPTEGPFRGAYGDLSIDTFGEWTYALDNSLASVQALAQDQTETDTFLVQVSDGLGGVDTQEIEVVVNGTNDAPVIDTVYSDDSIASELEGDVTVGSNTSDSGQVFAEDVDHGDSPTWSVSSGFGSYDQVSDGQFGTLTVDEENGDWTYQLYEYYYGSSEEADVFTVRVDDEAGEFDTQTLTIAIHSDDTFSGGGFFSLTAAEPVSNEAPTIAAPESVTLDESGSFVFTGGDAIVVADAENDVLHVALSVEDGTLNLVGVSGAFLELNGTADEINQALADLTYEGPDNFDGIDELTIAASDFASSMIADTIRKVQIDGDLAAA